MKDKIIIEDASTDKVLKALDLRGDAESKRIKRLLEMPDLSRTAGSPINEIVDKILEQPSFKDFDTIKTPEIVDSELIFNLFDYPSNHPERSPSNTYYLDDKHILRPLTTIMWHYYLSRSEVKEKLTSGKPVGFFSFGKVYRKDEIDRNHMNVFHQMDGGFLIPKSIKEITIEDLKDVLANIAKAVFGSDIKYRFNPDKFPYTDPSLEMEVDVNGRWIEVLGCGIMTNKLMANLGLDPDKWSNWAFGFGLERLAIISTGIPDIRLLWSDDERVKRQLKLGQKYQEVSKYPPVVRDISFIVGKNFVLNDYFDAIRDIGGNLMEEVSQTDKYENEQKFGAGRVSYTFRVTYRSLERTLTNEEVNDLHKKVEEMTKTDFGGQIRLS